MSKEPYYNSSSSSSYIKPANDKCYSANKLDFPFIDSKLLIAPAKFNRFDVLEPYYYKKTKIQTATPILIDSFRYSFDNIEKLPRNFKETYHEKYQECAILEDDDVDQNDDDDNEYDEVDDFFIHGFEISAPKSITLSRKVSDNYNTKLDNDTDYDSDFPDEKYCDIACNSIPYCITKIISPPDVNDITELKSTLQEKIDNPNVITNPKSRSLSMSLQAPKLTLEKKMNLGDFLQDSTHKVHISDDYQLEKTDYFF